MATTLEETYLVNVDSGANANKFYRATLNEDGTIQTNWGRVGASGQSQVKTGGRAAYESLIRAKERKGYSRVEVLAPSTTSAPAVGKERLKAAASVSLTGGSTDPVLTALVERLVAVNKHQLLEASGGMISVDMNGQVTTPLGIISADSIRQARGLLDTMSSQPAGPARARATEEYLRLVPQKVSVSAGRGWAQGWLDELTTPQKQYTLLDGLAAAVSYADAARRAQAKAQADAKPGDIPDDLFRYRVSALAPDSADYRMVVDRYETTKQAVHSHVRGLRVKNVYALTDTRHADETAALHKRLRNVRRLWHGTGAANVLSILQKGLFVPPTSGSGIHIAGRLLGNYVYASRSASKSLGYSTGLWGGSRGTESTFMFLTHTALGWECRASAGESPAALRARAARPDSNGKKFNSIVVEQGMMMQARNHEAVVFDPLQMSLSYLVEFGS